MNDTAKPLITTIIPTYRRPKLLRRAISSVLNQTYPHFQVCVYDNASGDETASVVAELSKEDPRVKYHCHAENIGATENFIYGMEHVEIPFFTLLSDDDLIFPNFGGKTWQALMSLAFVPFYIKFMGIESYGLVGIFASLLALFRMLDMGLSTTLNREMARLPVLPDKAREMRNLVRTLELPYWGVAFLIGFAMVGLSGPIACY